jgi:hypothetical protein
MTTHEIYALLNEARTKAIAYRADSFAPEVIRIVTGIWHPDSMMARMAEQNRPGEVHKWLEGRAEQLAVAADSHEATPLSNLVLALCARLELSIDRGIMDSMTPPPNTTQAPKPAPDAAEQKPGTDDLRAWRIECFRDLEFPEKWAEALADAKTVDTIKIRSGEEKRYESPLHHGKVKKMLAEGCTHKQIVNLLT